MRMMTKLLLLITVFMSGCWDKIETQEIALVLGVGIDLLPNDTIRVTLQAIDSSQSSGKNVIQGGTKSYYNTVQSGRTLEETIQKFSRIIPRRINFSHNSVVILGENFARKNFRNALDFFQRHSEFRRTQTFIVTNRTALEVLTSKVHGEEVPAHGLHVLVMEQKRISITMETTQLNLLNQYLYPSNSPILTWIDLNKKNEALLKGIGIFRGTDFIDYISYSESRGILWFLGEVRGAMVDTPCHPSKPKQRSMLEIVRSKVSVKPLLQKEQLTFHVKIKGEGELKTLCNEINPTPKQIRNLEKGFAKEIQQEMGKSLKYLQSKKTDAIQLGYKTFQSYPEWWRTHAKDWTKIFANVPVTYDIHIKILRTGLITNPPLAPFNPQKYSPNLEWEDDQP